LFVGVGCFASLMDWTQETGLRGEPGGTTKETDGFAWGGVLSLGVVIEIGGRWGMDLTAAVRPVVGAKSEDLGGLAPVQLGVRYRL
jgi:hypothetical protein